MRKTLLIIFFIIPTILIAQKGKYVGFYSSVQKVAIKNEWDMGVGRISGLDRSFNLDPTYSYGFGLNYYSNATENIGFKTGFKYNKQGQSYSANLRLTNDTFSYISKVRLDYIKVPLIINFGVNEEYSPVYFTMGFGLQFGYLLNAYYDIETSKDVDFHNGMTNYDYKDFFKTFETSFLLSTDLLFRLDKNGEKFLQVGLTLEKTIGGIMKRDEKDKIYSDVLQAPFGTIKDNNIYTLVNQRNSEATKNETYLLKLGYIIKIGD